MRNYFRYIRSSTIFGILGLSFIASLIVGWLIHYDSIQSRVVITEQTGTLQTFTTQRMSDADILLISPIDTDELFPLDTQSSAPVNPKVTTDVRVNNQSIPVPTSGSSHTEIINEDGKTIIDVSSHSTSSESSDSRSSLDVRLRSSNTTKINNSQ